MVHEDSDVFTSNEEDFDWDDDDYDGDGNVLSRLLTKRTLELDIL
jgi:hypothetical protein